MSSDSGKHHSPPRRAGRSVADLLPNLKATILAGPDVRVINVSKFGMLIESDERLSPNASVCLNITLDGRTFPASGRVLRVDAALSGGRVTYRAGIALDADVAAFDLQAEEPEPARASVPPAAAAPAAAAKPAAPQPKPQPQPQAKQPAAPEPAAPSAQQAQQAQEAIQLLRTALKTSEAQRKDSAAAHEAERARWDEQRLQYEQAAAQAKQSAETAQKQADSAQKDAATAQKDAGTAQKDLAAAQRDLGAAQKDLSAARQEAAAARKELSSARDDMSAAQKLVAAAKDAEWAHAKAEAAWDAERATFEKRLKDADARAVQLMKELREAAEREKSLDSRYRVAKAEWDAGRGELQQTTEEAVSRADRASRELSASKENEKRLSRKIDEQAESINAFLADKRRMEADIEALRVAAAVAEEAVSVHEQERAAWTSQTQTLVERLELNEKLCTDQKDLLFHLRQQIGDAFSLIDSWDPRAENGEEQPAADSDTKVSAVQRLRKIIG